VKLTAGKGGSLIVLLALAVVFPSSLSVADTVYLNGGRKVIGIIDRTSSDDRQVTIKTSFGTQKIPRIKIKAINVDENTSYTEAMGAAQKVVIAEAYILRGDANRNLLETNSARQNYQAVLTYLPDYPDALDGMGMTFQADRMHKDAEMWFIRAINAAPKNQNYCLSLAINLNQHRKQEDKALNYYMEYIRLGGRDPKVRAWIREYGGTPPEF